ncbi:MAG: hypothetical protein NVSMB47_05250 [Polyangiales bacterium]
MAPRAAAPVPARHARSARPGRRSLRATLALGAAAVIVVAATRVRAQGVPSGQGGAKVLPAASASAAPVVVPPRIVTYVEPT